MSWISDIKLCLSSLARRVTIIEQTGGSDPSSINLASPPAIGNVTPNTGKFTTLQATSGITGNVTGNVSGTSANFTGLLSGDVTGTQLATAISAATVTGKALTGYVSGAGTISAADSILTALNKLNGNDALKANIASPTFTGTVSGTFSGPLTGNVTGNVSGSAASFTGALAGDVTGTQSATAVSAATVTGKALTGYVSGAGTISATDSLLTAINKLNGNTALKADTSSLGTLATVSPTGTANATTYLRGDGAWTTVAAGGVTGTGAVDNAILRADGSGGTTLQSSNVRIEDIGQITWPTVLGAINHILGPTDQDLKIGSPASSVASAAIKTISLIGGNHSLASVPAEAGGGITLSGGQGYAGGSVTLSGGRGVGTSFGGVIIASGSFGHSGGGVSISGGNASNGYQSSGGGVTITTGLALYAFSGGVPGNISLTPSRGYNAAAVNEPCCAGGGVSTTTGAGGSSLIPSSAAAAGGAYTVTGGPGGAALQLTGTATGGAGGPLTLTSGVGGTATSATTGTRTGGNSGAVTLATGAAGAGTTTQGNSGDITLATGTGLFPGSIIATIAGVEKFRVANAKISCAVPLALASYTVGTAPNPAPTPTTNTGALIYITDDIGGAVPAFSDATNWRRVTDRAVVSVS